MLQELAKSHKPSALLSSVVPSVADYIMDDIGHANDGDVLEREAFVDQHLEAIRLHCETSQRTEVGPSFDLAQRVLFELSQLGASNVPLKMGFAVFASKYIESGKISESLRLPIKRRFLSSIRFLKISGWLK